MRTNDFDYNLPKELIAQYPITPRDASRLMVLDRSTNKISHLTFNQIGDYLYPGDLLVMNKTRVLPARIYGKKLETGGKAEILLLRKTSSKAWKIIVGGKGLRKGVRIKILDNLFGEIVTDLGGNIRIIKFSEEIEKYLDQIGNVPLPPYITKKLNDPDRYQTVYADINGSSAAPTAGLHFSEDLLDKLRTKGVKTEYVTLHIGLDTFAPVIVDDPRDHQIHTEWCEINDQCINSIKETSRLGGRIIAVGTTSVRALESVCMVSENITDIQPFKGETNLFILPGFEFKIVEGLITNYHLPRSTLLMLVSAFAGKGNIMNAYQIAIEKRYRFYSFGDAMFII